MLCMMSTGSTDALARAATESLSQALAAIDASTERMRRDALIKALREEEERLASEVLMAVSAADVDVAEYWLSVFRLPRSAWVTDNIEFQARLTPHTRYVLLEPRNREQVTTWLPLRPIEFIYLTEQSNLDMAEIANQGVRRIRHAEVLKRWPVIAA